MCGKCQKICKQVFEKYPVDRIRNVTVRQQIGLEVTIFKGIEQNQLTWYGHVQRMAEDCLK
jgi:hypothetical protein